MIALDTGPLVALFDKHDNFHAVCHAALKTIKSPLITTLPVLTKAFHLLGFSWKIQDDLWELVINGNLKVQGLDSLMIKKCREMMKKYHDLPMDFADASLVVVADTEHISTIFTLDHKDFSVYRSRGGKRFSLIPRSLQLR